MDGKGAPDFDQSELTIDQHGMLELIGNPTIREYRLLRFRLEPRKLEGVPNITPTQVVELPCPMVTVLGRDRLILPNGDMVEPVLLA